MIVISCAPLHPYCLVWIQEVFACLSDGCMAVTEQEVVDHLAATIATAHRGAHLIRSSLDRQLLCLVPPPASILSACQLILLAKTS